MLADSALGTALFFVVILALIPTILVLARYWGDRQARRKSGRDLAATSHEEGRIGITPDKPADEYHFSADEERERYPEKKAG